MIRIKSVKLYCFLTFIKCNGKKISDKYLYLITLEGSIWIHIYYNVICIQIQQTLII